MTPLHVRKLILFIMQRSSKNCMLLIGGVYIVSLEGFATVIIFSIIFDKNDIFSIDGLLVLDYEHIHVLLYGHLFNTMMF